MATSNLTAKYTRDSKHCKTIEYEYHNACNNVKTLFYSIHQEPLKTTLGVYIRDLEKYVKRSFDQLHLVDIENLHGMIHYIEPCTSYRLQYRMDCIDEEPTDEKDIKDLNNHEHARKEFLRILNEFKRLRNVIEEKAIEASRLAVLKDIEVRQTIENEIEDEERETKKLQIDVEDLETERKIADEKLSQYILDIEKKSIEREDRKAQIALEKDESERKRLSAFVEPDKKKKSILSDIESIDSKLRSLITIPQDRVLIENFRAVSFTIEEFEKIIIYCDMSSEILLRFLLACNFVNINGKMGVHSGDCLKTLGLISHRRHLLDILKLPGLSVFLDVLLVSNPVYTQLDNLNFLAGVDAFIFYIMAKDTLVLDLPDGVKYTSFRILENSKMEMGKFKFYMSEVVFALRKLVKCKSLSNEIVSNDEMMSTIHLANNMAIRKIPKLVGKRYQFATKLADKLVQVHVGGKQLALPVDVVYDDSGNVGLSVPDIYQGIWSLSSHVYIPGISSSVFKHDDRSRYTFSDYERNGTKEFIHVKFMINSIWKSSNVFKN